MLYSYDPELKKWMIQKNSGSPRYLHSAVIMDGLVLVSGGNTHNDTSVSYGAKCYSSDFMAYDITSNTWHHLPELRLKDEISRYGQSMVVKDGSVYMFGGFSGVMRNDLSKFETGVCDAFTDNISCNSPMSGVRCSWEGGVCVQKSPTSCNTSQATTCKGLNLCEECQAHPMCGWCNDPSNTERGRCMEGGRQGPVINATDHTIDLGQCPREQWFFTDCPKCQCNGHSTCLNESSSCDECKNLTTGSHCEKCQDGFFGNPKNGGECKQSIPEGRTIVYQRECSYYRSKFEHKDYPFAGEENTTFLVYVYDFKTPFWLQISFSQFPKIDLVHFFVTFFSCFLSLLLIAAALWEIKHKYNSYRPRQQMIVEMQQMASRPFATVTVDVDRKTDPDKKDHKEVTELHKRKRVRSAVVVLW